MTSHELDRYSVSQLPVQIGRRIFVDPDTGCWIWQGATGKKDGYGQIKWQGRGGQRVHRVVWVLLVGPIPPGHQVNHASGRGCRSKACCWPLHLEPVQMGADKGAAVDICDHAAGSGELHVTLSPEVARALADSGQTLHFHFHPGG